VRRCAAGVDVGGTKILGTVVDRAGEVRSHIRVPTPAAGEAVLDAVAGVVLQLWEAEPGAAGGAVGVGMPGLVDRAGVLRYAPNLPGVIDLDVAGGLARRLRSVGATAHVVVDNDATCATAAEHALGAAGGAGDAVMVTFGTGIGGGLVASGAIVHGSGNFAGEIGHMVVDAGGPVCACGGRGCWEVHASGRALGRQAREAAAAGRAPGVLERAGSVEAVQGEHVVEAALAGDAGAVAILERFGEWVAVGLANIANMLDPEVVVLGGGIVRAGPALLDPVQRAFMAAVEGARHRPVMRIVPALFGSEAGAVGAGVLALEAGD
jgi:glucokinase